jgi:hypothetical protein
MKKTSVLCAMLTLMAAQSSFATDYQCDDLRKTVVHLTKEMVSIAGVTYDLDEAGTSAPDDDGIYVMVDNEIEGKLEIDFQDSTDHGERVDSWSCTEVK